MGEVRCIGCARAARSGGTCTSCAVLPLPLTFPLGRARRPAALGRAALTAAWILGGVLSLYSLSTDPSPTSGLAFLLVSVVAWLLLALLSPARPIPLASPASLAGREPFPRSRSAAGEERSRSTGAGPWAPSRR